MNVEMLNDNVLVTELTDDLMVNGVATMYDSEAPYMFCSVVKSVTGVFDEGTVLVIRRYAKEEFLPGYYFISEKDIRCVVPEEVYNNLVIKS